MVNYQERLGRTFAALSDPTRRAIIEHLSRQESASVGELAQPFPMTLPAVIKHLEVLAAAGLITRSKAGRTVTVRLRPKPAQEAMQWLARYERLGVGSLKRPTAGAQREERRALRRGR